MHGQHDLGLDLPDDVDHQRLAHGEGAVDRHHQHVDAAELVEMLLGQPVVQVAQMGDAEIGDGEDEDRVAVDARRVGAPVAGVGRHVPHLHVLERDVVLGLALAGLGGPAAQRVGDAVLGIVGEMRRVGVVHGDDVGLAAEAVDAVVVGDRPHALRRVDLVAGMAEEGDEGAARRIAFRQEQAVERGHLHARHRRPRSASSAPAPAPPAAKRRRRAGRRREVEESSGPPHGMMRSAFDASQASCRK